MTDPGAELERELLASRKYRHLASETIQRVAAWALARYPAREAVKAAKRKLHQTFAAYCLPIHLDRLAAEVEQLVPADDPDAHRAGCREILRHHASTAERLEWLDDLYARLWRETGPPSCVLDLACGYHPFALPWMRLGHAEYHCCDIDRRLAAAANAYFARIGRPPTAACNDLLAGVPNTSADVVLLFKTVPCLEQQEKGAALRLLGALRGRWAVVSFPLGSLGGKDKGMRDHYARVMDSLCAALNAPVCTVECPNEVFYLLKL